jgi:hypothetical protein
MTNQIILFNKYRDIQHTSPKGRVLNNFSLYQELFKYITVKANQEFSNLKFNFHFTGRGNCQFGKVIDDKYLDLFLDIREIDTEDFDDFIFGRKSIIHIIEACCLAAGMDVTGINISTAFENAYESWDSYLNRIGYDERNLIASPETEKMKASINKAHVVWCHNKSCSGKTYTAIGLLMPNRKRSVYNPCFQSSCSYYFVKLLLTLGRDFTLLIDDIQCDVEKAKEIMDFICNNYHMFPARNIQVFIISWSSLLTENEFKKYSSVLPIYTTNPNDYIELLKNKINDSSLLSVCGDNIALLNAASRVATDNSYDSKKRLFEVFVHTDDPDKLKQIHRLCVLGIYEYAASQNFLGSPAISSSDINTLKISGSRYYAGHREICQFVASHIEQLEITGLQERYTIIKEYIMSVENAQKWKTLKQLVGENGAEDLRAVSPIWNTLNCFEQEIKIQTQKDPSWANTPSSMYFVLNTATLLGIAEEYINVLKSFCDKFILSDISPLISLKYAEIKTTNDFEQIRFRMIEEDSRMHYDNLETGEGIDCNQAHKNWVLGLVVGLKNELISAGYESLYNKAVAELFRTQTPGGFWYPQRVPWVTARIIIGLSQAGYTVFDRHVNKAVEYLFDKLGNESYWEAYTGGWNSIYETSSLCLEAIFKSGYKYEANDSVLRVTQYLSQHKEDWMAKNNEIDGSATACSLLKYLGIKQDLLRYVTDLCNRCIYDTVHGNETLDLNQVQSCKITQIASYTIELCWYIFERDLPSLLEQFVKRSSYKMSIDEMDGKVTRAKKIFISYSDDGRKHIQRIKRINDRLKSEGHTVYFYEDAHLGINNVEFMQNIKSCDIIIMIGTPKYLEKAMETKSGVFFEMNIAGDVYMDKKYENIIPVAFGEFSDSFPTPFGLSKGVRCKRVDSNFLNKLVAKINEK